MYRKTKNYGKTSIKRNEGYEGETIEERVERIINNKEGVEDQAPKIYTDRAEGVIPQYDVRNDPWDRAIEAKETIDTKAYDDRKKRIEEYHEKRKPKEDGKTEPTQGKQSTSEGQEGQNK